MEIENIKNKENNSDTVMNIIEIFGIAFGSIILIITTSYGFIGLLMIYLVLRDRFTRRIKVLESDIQVLNETIIAQNKNGK